MALHSYKSLQSSWETETFSRGAGSDFWASGSLQAAHCQNNTPLSGHIHLPSHSPAQPSSFPHAVARDANGTKHCVTHSPYFLPPESCGPWEGDEPHPQLLKHQAALPPLRKDPIASAVHCTAGWRPGRSQQGRCFFFRSNLLRRFLFSVGKLSCMHI